MLDWHYYCSTSKVSHFELLSQQRREAATVVRGKGGWVLEEKKGISGSFTGWRRKERRGLRKEENKKRSEI